MLRHPISTPEEDLLSAQPEDALPRPARSTRSTTKHQSLLAFPRLGKWEERQAQRAIRHWPQIAATLTIQLNVFAHLYSGRRRAGDAQHWFEHFAKDYTGSFVFLSVDTVISSCFNVFCNDLWAFLTTIPPCGSLRGILLGPPCESWSAARFMSSAVRRPCTRPPLRLATSPWGIPGRSLRELDQLQGDYAALARYSFGHHGSFDRKSRNPGTSC